MYLGTIEEAKTVWYDDNLKSNNCSDCIPFICNGTLRTKNKMIGSLLFHKDCGFERAPDRGGFKTGLRFGFAYLGHN